MNARLEANVLRQRVGSTAIPAALLRRDEAGDAMLSLQNRARYLAQSAATVAGQRAELPPGPTLAGVDRVFARLFGGEQ